MAPLELSVVEAKERESNRRHYAQLSFESLSIEFTTLFVVFKPTPSSTLLVLSPRQLQLAQLLFGLIQAGSD